MPEVVGEASLLISGGNLWYTVSATSKASNYL